MLVPDILYLFIDNFVAIGVPTTKAKTKYVSVYSL
jgi:hypothetical protein